MGRGEILWGNCIAGVLRRKWRLLFWDRPRVGTQETHGIKRYVSISSFSRVAFCFAFPGNFDVPGSSDCLGISSFSLRPRSDSNLTSSNLEFCHFKIATQKPPRRPRLQNSLRMFDTKLRHFLSSSTYPYKLTTSSYIFWEKHPRSSVLSPSGSPRPLISEVG